MKCKRVKRMISVLLCTMLMFTMCATAMAQTNEAEAHYMTDYENLGELFAELEPVAFLQMDNEAKTELYNTSVDDVLNETSNNESMNEGQRTAVTFNGSLSTSALLKGRLTYKPSATATVQATSISISGVVYNASGKIVDTKAQTENSVFSSSFSRAVTGLTSGEQHKVYVVYTGKFPSGSTPSSSTKTKTAYVNVK